MAPAFIAGVIYFYIDRKIKYTGIYGEVQGADKACGT
jgi:hypothetical protein